MSIPVKMCVQQFQSLRREGSPPFSLLAWFNPDEVRQMINAALVPGIRCTTLAQIRKISSLTFIVNVTGTHYIFTKKYIIHVPTCYNYKLRNRIAFKNLTG